MSIEDFIVVPFEQSFAAVYGHESLDPTHARVTVRPELLGPHGAVHSGVYAALAESLASTGTAVELVPKGYVVSGLSNATYVLAQIADGVLEAAATCRSRSDTEWLWDVETRSADTLAAQSTVVIAVRPMPANPAARS